MVTMAGIPGMGGGMSGGLGEPPPPYTTTPYINYGHNPEDSPYDTIGEPALASGTTAGAVVPVSEKSGLPPEYSPDNASANISHPGEHPGGLMNTPISANPGMPGMTSGQAEWSLFTTSNCDIDKCSPMAYDFINTVTSSNTCAVTPRHRLCIHPPCRTMTWKRKW